MSRLKRFEDYRYVGVRKTMRVYDCDDPEQFAQLSSLVEQGDLVARNGLQAFAPDSLDEARNRGYTPVAG